MKIEITIKDEKEEEFKEGFLTMFPVPIDEDTNEPIMNEKAWIKQWTKNKLNEIYREGKKKLAYQQVAIKFDDLVE